MILRAMQGNRGAGIATGASARPRRRPPPTTERKRMPVIWSTTKVADIDGDGVVNPAVGTVYSLLRALLGRTAPQ